MNEQRTHRWPVKVARLLVLLLSILAWLYVETPQRRRYDLWLQEDFRKPTSRLFWTVSTDWVTNGLTLRTDQRNSGIRFQARTTREWSSANESAIADWPVGTDPFYFGFEVQVDHARLQKYFEAGIAVVLCGKPPNQMSDDDLCIVFQSSYAGIGMAVWEGWFLAPGARQISETTGDVNGLESVPWHMQFISDTKLSFAVERRHTSYRMSVTSDALPHATPWHSVSFELNGHDALDVQNIVVQRVPVKPEHFGYRGFDFQGRVTGFIGYPLDDPPPRVDGYSIRSTAYPNFELQGNNLEHVQSVRFSNLPAVVPSSVTADRILFRGDPAALTERRLSILLKCGSRQWRSEVPNKAITELDSVTPEETTEVGGVLELHGRALKNVTSVRLSNQECRVVSHTQDTLKVATPELPTGRHTLTLQTNDSEIEFGSQICVGRHPKLLWDTAGRKRLKNQFRDPSYRAYVDTIHEQANRGDILSQVLLAEFEDSDEWLEGLLTVIRPICEQRQAITFDASVWADVAIVYDTLFHRLGNDDRDLLRGYLKFAIETFDDANDDWFFNADSNPSNTVAVGNSGGGLAALALLDTCKDAQRLAVRARQRQSDFIQATVRDDGGYSEGPLYWNYATSSYLRFVLAWRNSTLVRQDNYSDPVLAKMQNYVDAIVGGDGCMVTMNDTQPMLTGVPMIAFLGHEYNNGRLTQMADHFVDKCEDGAAIAFILRSGEQFNSTMPQMKACCVLPATQLATFRSSSDWGEGSVLSVFGATHRMSHHKQEDQGNLVYSLDGHRILIDPGYYLPGSQDHSVPIINGAGPSAGVVTEMTEVQSSEGTHFVAIDLTDAYLAHKDISNIKSVVRYVLSHGTDFVVIDEAQLVQPEKPAAIVEQLQLANTPIVTVEGTRTVVRLSHSEEASVGIGFSGSDWNTTVEGPGKFGRSWIFRRLSEQEEISWHTVRLARKLRHCEPAVWYAAASGSPPNVEVQKSSIHCRFSDGREITLRRSPKGWNWPLK